MDSLVAVVQPDTRTFSAREQRGDHKMPLPPHRAYYYIQTRDVKTVFNKTSHHFLETGYLPVIGLRDVMLHD